MSICPTCMAKYPEGVATCEADGNTLVPEETFAHVDRDLTAGTKVGEYVVEAKLGEGGFGSVYRAVHPVIGKPAAIKVLARQFSSNPQMVSRFIAEARAVNQIRNKNIIDIFAFGQTADGRQYYVMELLDGMPFDKYIAKYKRLSLDQAMPIFRGIARAMDAAHAKGILHRDLKPENVFLTFDEDNVVTAKLLDFGLVKLIGETSGNHKTKTGTPMGTPYYMSPEQCRGKEVDARTDVYSFGAMVFEVLTGKVPFDGDGPMEVLVKHMSQEAPPPSSLVPELTPAIDAAIQKMMAKEPEGRPATIGEALSDLARAANISAPSKTAALAPVPEADAMSMRTFGSVRTIPDVGENSGPVKIVTGSDARIPVAASPVSAPSGQTFLATEANIAPPRASRARVWAIAVIAAMAALASAAGIVTITRQRPASAAGGLVQNTSIPSTPNATAPTAPSATTPPAPTEKKPPEKVTIMLDGAPRGAKVSLSGKEIGEAPGPLELKTGEKVTLVIAAKGYKTRELTLVPTENAAVPVTLEKQAAGAKNPSTISKDLEKFE